MLPATWAWCCCVLVTIIVLSLNPPRPSYLYIELQSNSGGPQKVDLYYFRTGKAPEMPAHGIRMNQQDPARFAFSLPHHFTASGMFADLGSEPAQWTIHRIGYAKRVFNFDFETQYWSPNALAELIKIPKHRSDTQLTVGQELKISSTKSQPKIQINLDDDSASFAWQWLVAQAISILMLAGGLWLLFSSAILSYFIQLCTSRNKDYQRFSQLRSARIKDFPYVSVLGAFALVILVCIKLIPYWQAPALFIEDTMEFSDTNSGQSPIWDINTFYYYRGYFVLLSELIASLAAQFPITWQPNLYLLAGSVMSVLAVVATVSSGLFTSRFILLFAPSLLFFTALTDNVLYATLTSTLYSSSFLLMAILICPAPKSRTGMFATLCVIAVLSFSGPYGPQLIPFALVLLCVISDRRKAAILIFAIASLSCYLLTTQAGLMQFSNLMQAPILSAFFTALTEKVLFLDAFGSIKPQYGVGVIVSIILLLILARRDRIFIKFSLPLLACCCSSLLTFFISSKLHIYEGKLLSFHTVVSQFCWILFLLLCLDRLLIALNSPQKALVLILISFFGLTSTAVAKDRNLSHLTQNRYQPDPQLQEFLLAIQHVQALALAENEFIQLWYNRGVHYYDPSFYRGSRMENRIAYPIEKLPDAVQKYAVNEPLLRPVNSLVNFHPALEYYYYSSLEHPRFQGRVGTKLTELN